MYLLNYLYDYLINNYLNVLSNYYILPFYFINKTNYYTKSINTIFIPSVPFCLNLAVNNKIFLPNSSTTYILALYYLYKILTAYE